MYAAAGGASLASRQARRKEGRKHHVISSDAVHQQFQRRFQQLHEEHARLYQTDLNGRLPAHADVEGKASAAWSERERRASAFEYQLGHGRAKVSDSHRKWTRRNRIHDASFGGSSSEEDDREGAGGGGGKLYGHQSAAANALLYVGLGTVAIGLVIAFVGTGEKGFKTLELRLIGPALIGGGLLCCLVRVLLCVCPSRCLFRRPRPGGGGKRASGRPPEHDYYRHLPYHARTARDFLLAERDPPQQAPRGDKKRVSIIQTPSTSDKKFVGAARGRGEPPDFVESPVREPESLELRRLAGGNSFDDLPSVSSEDSFNEPESLALVEGSRRTCVVRDERLARLKSTLTFQDDVLEDDLAAAAAAADRPATTADCPRIEEEREEELCSPSNENAALPLAPSASKRELVLSPAKLQNI